MIAMNDVRIKDLKFLENFKSDRYLFRVYNSKKVNGCAANRILRTEGGDPYAVKCNCGHNTYHPVVDEGKNVDWNPEFLIKEKNQNLVYKLIKKLWAKYY